MGYKPEGVSDDQSVNAALTLIERDLTESVRVSIGRLAAVVDSPSTDLKAVYDLMGKLSYLLSGLEASQRARVRYEGRAER